MSEPPPPYDAAGYVPVPVEEKGKMPPQNPAYPALENEAYPAENPGYPPPQIGFQPPPPIMAQPPPMAMPPQQTTVIVTNMSNQLGPYPVNIQCPKCMQQAPTVVTYSAGGFAYLMCALICLFGGGLGCCLIPFCVDALQDAEHRCSNCQHYLGAYRRM